MFQIASAASVAFVQTCSLPLLPVFVNGFAGPIATVFAASWNEPSNSDASLMSTFSLAPLPDVLNVPVPVSLWNMSVEDPEPLFQWRATVEPLSTSSTGP